MIESFVSWTPVGSALVKDKASRCIMNLQEALWKLRDLSILKISCQKKSKKNNFTIFWKLTFY